MAALGVLLVAIAWPAAAPAQDLKSLERLRAQDLRVATIGYRLATADPSLCGGRRAALPGLALHDLSQYRPALRPLARRAFGLGDALGISSVVPDSAAARAGLEANDQIVAIDGRSLVAGDESRPSRGASHGALAARIDALENALAGGAATLHVERQGRARELNLVPVEGCASRFQLVPGRALNAWADGRYVSLTTGLLDFIADDDELAVVLAHELAHNILEHRARLKAAGVEGGLLRAFGRNAARVRATEVEADRMGLRLMHAAGFDLAAARRFWGRYAERQPLTGLAVLTHPGFRARMARIEATIVELQAGR